MEVAQSAEEFIELIFMSENELAEKRHVEIVSIPPTSFPSSGFPRYDKPPHSVEKFPVKKVKIRTRTDKFSIAIKSWEDPHIALVSNSTAVFFIPVCMINWFKNWPRKESDKGTRGIYQEIFFTEDISAEMINTFSVIPCINSVGVTKVTSKSLPPFSLYYKVNGILSTTIDANTGDYVVNRDTERLRLVLGLEMTPEYAMTTIILGGKSLEVPTRIVAEYTFKIADQIVAEGKCAMWKFNLIKDLFRGNYTIKVENRATIDIRNIRICLQPFGICPTIS